MLAAAVSAVAIHEKPGPHGRLQERGQVRAARGGAEQREPSRDKEEDQKEASPCATERGRRDLPGVRRAAGPRAEAGQTKAGAEGIHTSIEAALARLRRSGAPANSNEAEEGDTATTKN